jgi:hypothetical protein
VSSGIEIFVLGILAMASIVITLFFLKFWKKTRDSLFLAFAGLFAVECTLRTVRAVNMAASGSYEEPPWLYGLRLVASLLILLVIVRKNYPRHGKKNRMRERSSRDSLTHRGGD